MRNFMRDYKVMPSFFVQWIMKKIIILHSGEYDMQYRLVFALQNMLAWFFKKIISTNEKWDASENERTN